MGRNSSYNLGYTGYNLGYMHVIIRPSAMANKADRLRLGCHRAQLVLPPLARADTDMRLGYHRALKLMFPPGAPTETGVRLGYHRALLVLPPSAPATRLRLGYHRVQLVLPAVSRADIPVRLGGDRNLPKPPPRGPEYGAGSPPQPEPLEAPRQCPRASCPGRYS